MWRTCARRLRRRPPSSPHLSSAKFVGALGDSLRRISIVEAALLADRRHRVEYLVRSSAFPAIVHRMERAELAIDDSMERLSDRWRSESAGFARRIEESAADLARMAGERIERSRTSIDERLGGLAQRDPSGTMRLAAGTIDHAVRMMTVRVRGDLSLRKKEISGKLGVLAGSLRSERRAPTRVLVLYGGPRNARNTARRKGLPRG